MIEKNIGRLTIKYYNSIDELPTENYHKFNLYALIDSGIGSDTDSIKTHIEGIYAALQKKDFDRLKVLFGNYYMSLSYITEGLDMKSIAVCYMIHSVNGKLNNDLSDEAIHKLAKKLAKHVKRQHFISQFTALKKKLMRKSNYISPIELARQKHRAIIQDLSGLPSFD